MRKKTMKSILLAAVAMVAPCLTAQEAADKTTLNFSDASRPGTVKVNTMQDNISVKTHAAKEVLQAARAVRGECPPGSALVRRLFISATASVLPLASPHEPVPAVCNRHPCGLPADGAHGEPRRAAPAPGDSWRSGSEVAFKTILPPVPPVGCARPLPAFPLELSAWP